MLTTRPTKYVRNIRHLDHIPWAHTPEAATGAGWVVTLMGIVALVLWMLS